MTHDRNETDVSARRADKAGWIWLSLAAVAVVVILGLMFAMAFSGGESAVAYDDDVEDMPVENVLDRPECPVPGEGSGESLAEGAPLAGVMLPCLGADQQGEIDLGAALAGQPAVVNFWAWNCAPCREEMPMLQQWSEANPDIQLVGVQQSTSPGRGAAFLDDVGVPLRSYQDTDDVVGPVLGLPKVVPITVIFDAEGNARSILPTYFTSIEEIDQAVAEALA
ncbi:TlpA family protein disulfide reductase [Corynebacterium sputi]|uniref:TlpA family protein disulfide reductase n=1 Tax=Corynebacterium sputi TaxID=489915 RepID=UPI000408FF09|nr:TlpA disulfide reductase family protein [Corynebacterium sputi]